MLGWQAANKDGQAVNQGSLLGPTVQAAGLVYQQTDIQTRTYRQTDRLTELWEIYTDTFASKKVISYIILTVFNTQKFTSLYGHI